MAEQEVQAVKQALYKMVPEYKHKLEATEYTYFLGVSKASCTKWHSDSEEHENVWLLFTSLTLLSSIGTTSMCIAGKEETWLKEPFDTVLFDPNLIHRSGETNPHVMKLSIHWKMRSGSSSVPAGVTPIEVGEGVEAKEAEQQVVDGSHQVKQETEDKEGKKKVKEEAAETEVKNEDDPEVNANNTSGESKGEGGEEETGEEKLSNKRKDEKKDDTEEIKVKKEKK